MDRTVIIIHPNTEDRINVKIHSDDAFRLIKLLTDQGYIDYELEFRTYDTNEYSTEV